MKKLCTHIILLMSVYITHAQSGQWVYWGGSNNDSGYYGKQGLSSPLNEPPARVWSACWTDNEGRGIIFPSD